MDDALKTLIEDRIKLMGVKKEFIAKKIGLDKVRFSQTMAGKRKIQPEELKTLKLTLGIA